MKQKNNKAKRAPGFTLIEVVVALFILSLALVSIMQLVKSTTGNMIGLKQHQVAQWVGMNYLVEEQIKLNFPKIGKTSSKIKMANKMWYLDVTIIQAADKNLRKIVVEVFNKRKDQNPVYLANGYKSKLVLW